MTSAVSRLQAIAATARRLGPWVLVFSGAAAGWAAQTPNTVARRFYANEPQQHPRSGRLVLVMPADAPHGSRICAEYARGEGAGRPNKGKVKVTVRISRGNAELATVPFKRTKVGGNGTYQCQRSVALLKGDVLDFSFKFSGMPRLTDYRDFEYSGRMDRLRPGDNWLEIQEISKPPGSTITNLTVEIAYSCDDPDRCNIGRAMLTGRSVHDRIVTASGFNELVDTEFAALPKTGVYVAHLGCPAEPVTTYGILVQMYNGLNGELADEIWTPAVFHCDRG